MPSREKDTATDPSVPREQEGNTAISPSDTLTEAPGPGTLAALASLTLLTATAMLLVLPACGGGDGKRGRGTNQFEPTPTAGAATKNPGVGGDKTAYTVAASATLVDLRTLGAGVRECTAITATVKNGTALAAKVDVAFEIVAKSGQKQSFGTLNPTKTETDAKGVAVTQYCTGKTEGKVAVSVAAGVATAVSQEIEATAVPVYRLSYKDPTAKAFSVQARAKTGEDLATLLASPLEDTDAKKPIEMNLSGGGKDCNTVEFELTKNGEAVSGQKITFQTQEDYPIGVKLAKREGVGATGLNAVSGKRYAVYEGTSNAEGVFQVPICSGAIAGNVLLSADYTDPNAVLHAVKSPLITMNGGIANYGFLSLTYDAKNARVASGDVFTNTGMQLPFLARIGTRNDGGVLKSYPIGVITELGKAIVEKNGFPDDDGKVKFTYELLNLSGMRPWKVHSELQDVHLNSAFPDQDGVCDPADFPTAVDYMTLADNWRSTMTYYVKGSEYYRDSNQNGLYDASAGDGFWDKNENGKFDTCPATTDLKVPAQTWCDVLTYDYKSDNLFDATSEWFIDLPSPFVDANENGRFDDGELLVGDKFVLPNGKYDSDTYIWKNTKLPVSVGETAYSITHSRILDVLANPSFKTPSAGWVAYHAALAPSAGAPFRYSITAGELQTNLFGLGNAIAFPSSQLELNHSLYFHAQDKCGSPLPGATKLTTNVVPALIQNLGTGDRKVTTHFYVQPYDSLREPSKRLLSKSDGSSEAEVNFDTFGHPAASASYPIELQVKTQPCNNFCKGATVPAVAVDPPLYCPALSGHINLTIGSTTIRHNYGVAGFTDRTTRTGAGSTTATNPCGCMAGATMYPDGNCTCPEGTAPNAMGSACVPP